MSKLREFPDATVTRLPVYLRALASLAERGVAVVSSEHLARSAGVGPSMLRKDLSLLGRHGTRGVGYDVGCLVSKISQALGLSHAYGVAIVGVGNLGRALANYAGFSERGFVVRALFDSDPLMIGQSVAGVEVAAVDQLEQMLARYPIEIGMIATPAGVAQRVCDRLVAGGVTGILNFAPVPLAVPDGVELRKVDLSVELQVLAFHEQRRLAGAGVPG